MVTIKYQAHVLVLHLPYNPGCIHELKETIPYKARAWDPELKVWYIGLPYLDLLIETLQRHFKKKEIFINKNVPIFWM